MFLVNSRSPLVSAARPPSPHGASGDRAPLLPKLRGHLAEFLHHGSPARLGILCRTTCVGIGYGRLTPSRRGFSRHHRITLLPHPQQGRSPSRLTLVTKDSPPDLPGGRATRLDGPSHQARGGYHCASPLLTRLPTKAEDPQTRTPPPPPGPKPAAGEEGGTRRGLAPTSQHGRCPTGTGISTRHPSTTPVGLALGPDSPRADEPSPGTLGHTAPGTPTPVSLLMPASSLPHRPPGVTPPASPSTGRSPTTPGPPQGAGGPRLRRRA